MFFDKKAKLKQEFKRLFGSLFTSPKAYTSIVTLLAGRHSGYSRDEIADSLNVKGGGTLTKMLEALIAGDFIRTYVPFGAKKREVRYKLIDNFCQFAIRFVEDESITDNQFWQHSQNTPVINAWRGIAFEQVCFSHTRQIKNALDVGAVISNESVWATPGDDEHPGAQIDMIISRNDRVTNLCEMKFVSGDYNVTADEERRLRNRVAALQEHLSQKQTIHLTLITTYGLKQGAHSGIFQNVVTAADIINS